MTKEKKRICLALANVNAEDAIIKVIQTRFANNYEIAENVRSREALVSAINREKFDCVIMREDLTGNVDLIDLFKNIRANNSDIQIIFLMTNRENGDPFFIELFLFNIYDFIVLPDVRLDEIFGFLSKPRAFKDVIRFLPVRAERIRNLIVEANNSMKEPPKLSEDGDVDEVITVRVKPKTERHTPQNNYYPQAPVQQPQPAMQPIVESVVQPVPPAPIVQTPVVQAPPQPKIDAIKPLTVETANKAEAISNDDLDDA